MNREIIKLSILVFFAGFFGKLYDDLNDNNLFTYLLLDKNKEYINEFLKAAHYILLIYVSSTHIYPLLLFVIPNIFLMINDSKGYELPYEYSGMIAGIIFSFYLIINNFEKLQPLFNYYVIFFITIYLVGTYIFDTLLCKNIEFGYKKLAVRGFAVILLSSVLLINYYFKLLPDELIFCSWYIIGYCLTSCFFQIFLIWKSTQQDDKPVDKLVDDKPVDKPVDNKTQMV
jgi:hypothetical protein